MLTINKYDDLHILYHDNYKINYKIPLVSEFIPRVTS
jgi:hypothetical protein